MSENRTPEEKNIFDEIREKADPVIDKVMDTAKPVIEDVAEAAKPVIDKVSEAAKPAFDRVVDAAKHVGERIGDKLDDITDGEKNSFFRDLKQQARDQKEKAAADAEEMQKKLRELMNKGK